MWVQELWWEQQVFEIVACGQRELAWRNDIVAHGYIAQWLERLTADQQVPGSNPGVPLSQHDSW